jgi:hypothetical protein
MLTSYCPFSLFHLTRAIMKLQKSQTGSDHITTSYCLFSHSLPPDKSNNDLLKSQTGSDHMLTSSCPLSPTLPSDKINNDSVKEPDRK